MIIGFGHKSRQGKDTAGEAIIDFCNIRFLHGIRPQAKRFSFADALYRTCREEYGMVGKDGPLLQKVGEGRRNEFGLGYWIKQIEPDVKAWHESGNIAMITDMRYINEADWVKSIGGHTANVSRLNEDGTPYITDDRDPNFVSEIQLDGYNYDFYLKAKTGQTAFIGEQAITLAEYLRGLETNIR